MEIVFELPLALYVPRISEILISAPLIVKKVFKIAGCICTGHSIEPLLSSTTRFHSLITSLLLNTVQLQCEQNLIT